MFEEIIASLQNLSQCQTSKMKSDSNQCLQPVTILLIFLFTVIQQIFAISMTAVMIKKLKLFVTTTAKKFYLFAFLYLITKLVLCVFLQIRILTDIKQQFKDVDSEMVQKVFDNAIALGDIWMVQLFLVSFEHYMTLTFSIFGNKKAQQNVRIILKGVQALALLALFIPLLLFNSGLFVYSTLNIFNMSINCLCVVVFIAAFFFMNFKMTGLMMDRRSSEIIKRVYALSILLLFSRLIMSVLQVWVQINITNGSFEDFITVIQQNQNQMVVLGFVFIGELLLFLLSQGLCIVMSLRETIVVSMSETARSRSLNLLDQSLITNNQDTRDQGFMTNDILFEPEGEKAYRKSNKIAPESYYGLSKIEDPDQLQVLQKINISSNPEVFTLYKSKWVKNGKFYFVRKLGNISNYIVEEILNQIEGYVQADVKVVNHMKILQKGTEDPIYIIQRFLPEKLSCKMQMMIASTLNQKINLAIKIAKAIKQFHQILKIGHGVLNPNNILFDEDGNVYLTGFGMQSLKKYLSLTTEYTNITMYTAVELFSSPRQKTISKAQTSADIYSFGIILYQIVANNFKYRNLSVAQIRNKFIKQNTRPKIPESMHEDLKKVMRKCWQENPINRPDIIWVINNLESIKIF